MLWLGLLVGFFIGMQVGWYARHMRDLCRLLIQEIRNRQAIAQEAKRDDSGVITHNTTYQKGKIIDLPPYEESNIVRSPTPQEVKARQQRAHEQDLMNI